MTRAQYGCVYMTCMANVIGLGYIKIGRVLAPCYLHTAEPAPVSDYIDHGPNLAPLAHPIPPHRPAGLHGLWPYVNSFCKSGVFRGRHQLARKLLFGQQLGKVWRKKRRIFFSSLHSLLLDRASSSDVPTFSARNSRGLVAVVGRKLLQNGRSEISLGKLGVERDPAAVALLLAIAASGDSVLRRRSNCRGYR